MLGQKPLSDGISSLVTYALLFFFVVDDGFFLLFCTVLFCFYERESSVILSPPPAITMEYQTIAVCVLFLKRETAMELRQKCHIIMAVYS